MLGGGSPTQVRVRAESFWHVLAATIPFRHCFSGVPIQRVDLFGDMLARLSRVHAQFVLAQFVVEPEHDGPDDGVRETLLFLLVYCAPRI